jgi:CBS domain-containing protein
MTMTARDVMTTEFHTLLPSTPVIEAVKTFKRASEEEGKRVFGMMVTNSKGRLVGMLSMYDVLLFMRPKHIHIWGMMEDIDVTGLLDNACERARSVQVGDIMTTEVVTVTPETHVMMILDIMIKKHVRRVPVVENDKIHGILYISDLFYQLLGRLGE